MLDKFEIYGMKVPEAVFNDLKAHHFLEGLRRPGSTVNVLFDDIPIETRTAMSNWQLVLTRDLITREAAKRTNFRSEVLDKYLDDVLLDHINQMLKEGPKNNLDQWLAGQSDLVQGLFDKSRSPKLVRHS